MVLITTADDEFKKLRAEDFLIEGKIITVYDFWRILKEKLSGRENIKYIPIGCGVNDEIQSQFLQDLWGNEANI